MGNSSGESQWLWMWATEVKIGKQKNEVWGGKQESVRQKEQQSILLSLAARQGVFSLWEWIEVLISPESWDMAALCFQSVFFLGRLQVVPLSEEGLMSGPMDPSSYATFGSCNKMGMWMAAVKTFGKWAS